MANIAENLQVLVGNKADIKEGIERVVAETITGNMCRWADLLNAYEDELQDKSSHTGFPYRFPVVFKPEQTLSKYFPFSFPVVLMPPPMKVVYNITDTSTATKLLSTDRFSINAIASMTIDGKIIPKSQMSKYYAFSTTGSHVVEYELVDKTTVPSAMFWNVDIGKTITLPEGITSIGALAFNAAYNTTLVCPNSLTQVTEQTIGVCSRVTLGNNVQQIDGANQFRWTTYLTLYTVTPPSLVYKSNQFANTIAIYVPEESVDAYKTASNWSRFASKIQAIPT